MNGGFGDWIGRTERSSDMVTPQLVNRFEATFGRCGDARIGDPAPLGLHWCLAPVAVATAACGGDGHPERGLHLPPITLPRRMWAGGRLEFHGPLHVGDGVERLSRIEAIDRKDGRSGELWFVRVRHEWRTIDGVAIDEQQDIVYRGHGGEARGEPRPVPEGAARVPVGTNEIMLFRYSALTFNSHRIHYDRPYATGVEGYSGLVVHGPLQATLLLALAAGQGGTPKRFSFRGKRALIAGGTATLTSHRAGSGLDLWVADEQGEETLSARAEW